MARTESSLPSTQFTNSPFPPAYSDDTVSFVPLSFGVVHQPSGERHGDARANTPPPAYNTISHVEDSRDGPSDDRPSFEPPSYESVLRASLTVDQ